MGSVILTLVHPQGLVFVSRLSSVDSVFWYFISQLVIHTNVDNRTE